MKDFGKIVLKEKADILDNQRMKKIVGGYEISEYCYGGEYLFTCTTVINGNSTTGVVCATNGLSAMAKIAAAFPSYEETAIDEITCE
jgi:hypothetical protein